MLTLIAACYVALPPAILIVASAIAPRLTMRRLARRADVSAVAEARTLMAQAAGLEAWARRYAPHAGHAMRAAALRRTAVAILAAAVASGLSEEIARLGGSL